MYVVVLLLGITAYIKTQHYSPEGLNYQKLVGTFSAGLTAVMYPVVHLFTYIALEKELSD
jgi:hypothetical protein